MKQQSKKISDGKVFDIGVLIISAVISVLILYPLIFIVSASFSSPEKVMSGEMWLFPVDFTLDAYSEVFKDGDIWNGYKNTIFYTIGGTFINIILTTLAAYPLSRRDLPGRNIIMFIITFTMFFSGGMIPTFLVVQGLGMVDTFWAMIIPNAIATYNLIVMRTYFQTSIPWELQEAAMIDGCSNWKMLWKVILPLSKPIIAVMLLFYAVGHWNAFFNALIYLRDDKLILYSLYLEKFSFVSQANMTDEISSEIGLDEKMMLGESIKYALIIVASLPVLVIYPFVQKHLSKE